MHTPSTPIASARSMMSSGAAIESPPAKVWMWRSMSMLSAVYFLLGPHLGRRLGKRLSVPRRREHLRAVAGEEVVENSLAMRAHRLGRNVLAHHAAEFVRTPLGLAH